MKKTTKKRDLENFLKAVARMGGEFLFKGGGLVVFVITEGSPIVKKLLFKGKRRLEHGRLKRI